MKKLILAILILVVTAGCATFNKVVQNNELVSRLAIESATGRVIIMHPSWKDKVVKVTDMAIEAVDAREVTTIDTVASYVQRRIAWDKMLPEEQALLGILIEEVQTELRSMIKVQSMSGSDAELIAVKKVLTWINEAAKRQK